MVHAPTAGVQLWEALGFVTVQDASATVLLSEDTHETERVCVLVVQEQVAQVPTTHEYVTGAAQAPTAGVQLWLVAGFVSVQKVSVTVVLSEVWQATERVWSSVVQLQVPQLPGSQL